MKSKPPNKRARLDPASSSAAAGTASSSPNDKTAKGSPASAVASSSGSAKASTSATASELLAAAKMKAAAASAAASGILHTPQQQMSLHMQMAMTPFAPFQNLSIPDFNKEYPKMASISINLPTVGVTDAMITQMPMDDLDVTQAELETLGSSLALRLRTIDKAKSFLKNMPASTTLSTKALGEHYDPNHQEKINAIKNIMDSGHGTRTSVSAAAKLVMGTQLAIKTHVQAAATASSTSSPATVSPITGSSRKSNNSAAAATIGLIKLDKQPKKKIKVEVGGKRNEKAARGVQNRTHSISMDDSSGRLEVPNQFWDFTDTYCHNITAEDVDKLEKLIEAHKSLPEGAFNIPPLGKHFKGEGNGTEMSRIKNHDSQKAIGIAKAKDVCGPLTQRLVAALVDDRVNHYSHQANGTREDTGEGFFTNRPGLAKALGLEGGTSGSGSSGGPHLESKLRQVLLEQGLLHPDEDSALMHPDDEILAEIKRTQNTLTKLHQYNSDKLKELHNMAKRELAKVSIKDDLVKADKEVIESYRLITSCRQKKKPLTKKEKEGATRALQTRKEILEKLFKFDSMPIASSSSSSPKASSTASLLNVKMEI